MGFNIIWKNLKKHFGQPAIISPRITDVVEEEVSAKQLISFLKILVDILGPWVIWSCLIKKPLHSSPHC